jgi:glycerophosphoryl diester phosphodiesterase
VVAASAHSLLLSDADIYFYVTTWPPRFWLALALVVAAACCAAATALWLALRWCLGVPICILQRVSALSALRQSAHATRGQRREVLLTLTGWVMGMTFVSGLVAMLLVALSKRFLSADLPIEALARASIVLAFVDATILAVLACLFRGTLAILVMRLYVRSAGEVMPPATQQYERIPRSLAWRASVCLLLLVLPAASAVQAARTIRQFDLNKPVAVTAHRGGSSDAPENTLAAIEQAIEVGADYAELDAQETMDGEVVLLHDTDLRRVAGAARSIWDVTYADIRDLDVGSWFSPRFRSERIPTLRAAAATAKGRIKLNIELKVNGHGVDLPGRVVSILREVGVQTDTIVSSLDLATLRRVREIDPTIPLGFIVATGVGNLLSLDVDFFPIARRLATPGLIHRLTSAGRSVHVWTLDREDTIVGSILDGADNIITGDPALAIATRRMLREMNPSERTLLRLNGAFARGEFLLRAASWPAVQD